MSRRRNGREDEPAVSPAPSAPEQEPAASGLEPHALDSQPAEAGGDELARLRRESSELKEALLRRRAEFENFRKRVERDRGTAAVEAEAALLRQLLGTVDNLERALAAQDATSALREGVLLTHRELLAMLESLGVAEVEALGQRFDPTAHQAIQHEPAAGFAPGTVSEVFRKGFRYRDRLLRPALVKVASEGADTRDDGGDVQ